MVVEYTTLGEGGVVGFIRSGCTSRCLLAHAKANNKWSFMVYRSNTRFKTLKRRARPREDHNTVGGYNWGGGHTSRKRQEQSKVHN